MSRKIKFRIWDKKKNQYLKPTNRIKLTLDGNVSQLQQNKKRSYSISKNCIVQQYIGFNDKNGKEIYEGDIISCDDGLLEIKFNRLEWTAETKMKNNALVWFDSKQITVIGNVFENGYLLENKKT